MLSALVRVGLIVLINVPVMLLRPALTVEWMIGIGAMVAVSFITGFLVIWRAAEAAAIRRVANLIDPQPDRPTPAAVRQARAGRH